MANNPYVNKVQKADGTTLIDLTSDTAVASDVASGKYFHLATGERVAGTASGGGTVTITDTLDTHGGTIRTITTDPAATIIEALNITQNGTYTPSSGHAYGPVVAAVAGGGSSYTLLGSQEYTVNTTSTSYINVGTFSVGSSVWTSSSFILATVRDKAGTRNEYFSSNTALFINPYVRNSSATTTCATGGFFAVSTNDSGKSEVTSNSQYGVYISSISADGTVAVRARYNSFISRTINGTYVCEVWALNFPTGFNPWGD